MHDKEKMKDKKIIVADDTHDGAQLAEVFRNYYSMSKVNVVKNLSDLESYIKDEEKRGNIGIIFLDLTMNPYGLEKNWREKANKIGFSGWVFYDNVLKEDYKDLYDKTILYTAYGDRLYEILSKNEIIQTREEFDKLPMLHKTDEDLINKAITIAEDLLKSQFNF